MADWDGFKVLSLPGDESLPAPRRDRLSANEAGLARHVALTPDEQAESGAAWEEGRTSGELNAAISDARRKGDSRALAALIDARDGPNPFSDEPRGVNRRPADPWAGFKVVSQPKAVDLSPDALGKTASGDYLDAIGKGFSDLGTSLQSAKWVVTGKGTPEIAKALADQIANSNASAGEREIQGAVKSVNDAKGGWETAKSIGNLLWSFVSNPYDAGKMVVQQLPNALPSMATGAAGAGAGGLIGGPVGAVGGGLTGLAAGSGVVEFGAKLADKVGEALGNRPATPENIQAILEQPGFRDAAMQEGAAKGVTVGAIDALSAALGGRIATAPFRAAAKKALAREGIDLADTAAVNAALKTAPMQAAIKAEMAAVSTGRKVGMGATGVAADSTLEGVGEYAGEYAATGQGKLGDAILEGVTSLGQSVAEVSASAALQRGQGLIGGAPAAAEQRKQAVEDIARAPNVDSAIEAFTRATAPTPAATADAPIEFDRLGALGLINAAPIAAPEQVGPQHPLGDPNAIPYDYSTPAQRFAALPAPEAATGSGILVNDGDAELTRPEQFGDRETRINATQRAREDEADAPAVRDIVQTPEGPRRRPRVTLDEAGNVIDASPEDRQFLSLTRRDARPHAAAAIEAHAINPTLTEAVLAAPDMGPKAERAVFEAIANGTVGSPETQSVLARFGIAAGRLADTNGQGAQPGAAPAPGANPPGAGPGTGQGAGAQPNASGGDRGQGVAAFQIRGKWAHDMHAGALNLIARNSKSLVERAKARAELDRRNPNREFDRAAHESRKRLWRTIVQAGGISEKEAADIGIDPRSLGGYRMSGLITPNGMRADILARFLAEPGNDWLRQDQSEDDEAARQLVADLLARNPIGTPDEQNRYHELLAKKHGEAAAAAIDGLSEVEQAEVADYDDSAVAGAEAVVELIGRNVSEEEFLRALGASEQEIADVLKPRNGQENGEVAGGAGDAQETGSDAAESPDGGAETGDAALARDESGEGGNREGAAAVVEKPRYSVQSPDGKRFPVESLEEASRKWISSGTQAQRIAIMGDKAAVPIVDADGKTVALMDSAGRVSKMTGTDTPAGSDTTLVAPEKDVTPALPEKPKGDTDASLDRSRPREFMAFSKPYEGATGAKLVGYEWAQRKEEYVDRRGENRTRRVSDWDQAVKNLQTGRDVVHQFHITTKDGESHVVSAETAATMLGVAQSTVRTNAARLLQQEIDAQKKGEAETARVAELDAMESFATPAAAVESRKPDGYVQRVVDRALSEGKGWGSQDGDYVTREKYRFLTRDGKFIFSPELVSDGSALHAAGWRSVEYRANEIWDKQGNDKRALAQEKAAEPIDPDAAANMQRGGNGNVVLASRGAPAESVADMFGYTDADEDALLLDMDAQERAEYEKAKPRGMSWLDYAKQRYAKISHEHKGGDPRPYVSATYGADSPWQEAARGRDGDALQALRSEAARLEKDAPAYLYVNDDGTARITVFDVRDVPKRMLAFAARNNLKTDVVVNAGMLRAGQAMPADFRASGAKYAEEVKDPGAKAPLASRPGYTAPYRDLDAYRFTVAKDARGLPVYMSRNITLADGRVKDALGVPNGGRAIAFDIYDNRMRDAEGDPTVVGQVLVHQDAAGKFASFRNISIAKEYRNQGYYHGEGVVAGMLQHNGTTPMEVFNIQSAARGDKDDALPFWKKIGTTILNYSSTQDVDIEGNISLSRYLKAGEKRGINGQSSRDRREQPVSRRDGARGEQPDAGGNRGAQSLRASQSRTVRAVRAELTEAFGEDGVAALERAGILNITTWDAAPKGLTDQLQSGDNGAYWPSRQTAYIFADNLAPGQAAEVLLHEIGEHYGLEGLLGDQYGRVVAQVKTLHKAGQPEIVAAWRHVERNYDLTPGSAVFMKEVIARAGQSAKVHGMAWWQRMMDAIRAFLLKTGIKGVTSARDLGVLLQASVRKAMRDAKGMAGPVAVNADDYGMASRLGDQLKGLNKDTGGDLFKGAPELEGGMSFRDRQTSSPAFKRWFGDSKVVDADGNPLVVYHGTVGDHTFFDAATQGQYTNEDHGAQEGFFFTASKSDAGFFMERAWERRGGDRDANGDLRPWDGRVLEVYLQAQNPYTPPDEQSNYEAIRYAKANGFDAVHLPDGDDVNPGNTWIVFRPNQIKSAIDNNGNFDPNEPSVLASRGTIGATWDMLQSAKTPAQARALAMNLFDNPNKFNLWDKTIGTQLNKARKNEYFRAVFDNLQGQQDSTAAYAIEAEAEAADVLARMEGAAEIKSALKSTLTGERARDLQAVSKAIFANIEGKQGVKQKVFTDAELAKDFGLNDRQIGLYRQSRAAIDRSLDRYAQSLAVRMAQKFVYTGDLHRAGLDDTVDALTERLRLQRQVLEEQRLPEQSLKDMEARLAELEELQDSTPREILRSLQTGPDGETRQEYASMPDTAATAALQREIRDLKRAIRAGDEINPANRELDAKIQALDAALERLPEIADQAHSLQNAGYAPAMRFGDYAVTAYDASGETQFFTMVDTKTQANLLKMRLARELPGARIVVNPVDKESYKLFGGVDPATVELFARFMEVEETDAFKAYIALATSSRSALKHMLERKGIAGFSDNLPRVMAAFITSNARAAARNVHAFDVNAAMETAQREARGDVSEEAARLVNYMNNPTGDFAKVRGFMFAYFMGGSVSSALVNLTQPLMMTTPYLQQFAGAKIGAIMTRAAKAAATGKVEGAAKAALARAEAEGITDAHEYFQLMQEAEGGGSVPTRALMKAWGSMFGAAERFNRRITFLAAFEVAQSMAQKDLQARGVGDAYEFAKDAVVETQGLYNRANRPNWARTPLGALALTFKQFSIAWLEFFMRLPRKQQLMAVGLLILMAGLEGLPFAEDLEDLIDTIGQRMGYGTNSKRALRQAATSMLGETGAQFALHGISGLSGMPMDVAGRLGMGNLIPGTKLLNPSVKEKARELAEVAGPAAGLAQKAGGIAEGNLKEAMPKAFADAAKAWEIFQTGEYRDTRGRKVMEADGLDALMKLVGFQPRDVAANTRFIGEQMRDVEIVRRVESEIVEQWADGVRNKDVAESTEARERLKRWNAENPDLPIKVTFAQILRRVKQANLTRDERFMKTAPPELRRRMLAETAVQ